MELIRDLGMRETGWIDKRTPGSEYKHRAHFGLFRCPYCNSELEQVLSKGLKRESCVNCMGVRRTKHGMANSKPYNVWRGMLQRCTNPNNQKYHIYGGKGVKVCLQWQTFEGWWADNRTHYAEGLTIDRIDSNGDYCPENVRWIPLARNSSETTKRRPVIRCSSRQFPDGSWEVLEEYESALHAAKTLNLVAAHITATCQGLRKTHGGYAWFYADQSTVV